MIDERDAPAREGAAVPQYVIDGHLRIGRNSDALTFTWEGGEIIGIAHELLADAAPPVVTYAKFPDTVGDRLMVGPYALEVIELRTDCVIARRSFLL